MSNFTTLWARIVAYTVAVLLNENIYLFYVTLCFLFVLFTWKFSKIINWLYIHISHNIIGPMLDNLGSKLAKLLMNSKMSLKTEIA